MIDAHAHDDRSAGRNELGELMRALDAMRNGTCCSGGAPGPPAVAAVRFREMGIERFRETIRARKPRVPYVLGPYVLPDVTLVHTDSGARTEHVDVEIADAGIAAIRPAGAPSTRPCAVLSQYRGSFVSPSLCDLHVHFPPDNALGLTDLFLLQTLRHGITVVRDAGDTDGTATPATLRAVLSGAFPGPEIHYAYAFVNRPPARWTNCFDYTEPGQAARIVEELARWGARWVKSYENLDAAQIRALCDAAALRGLGVMGHVPFELCHEEALLPDAQHLLGVPSPRTVRRNHVLDRSIDWDAVDQRRLDAVTRASVAHKVALTPTLNVTRSILELERHESACETETARALPDFYAQVIWHPRHGIPAYRGIVTGDFERARRALGRKYALVRQLHREGVELRLGTDTQQPFVAPGVSLHREIESFEHAGIGRAEVLRMATVGAARALGLGDVGTLEPGARAELLVSRGDPRETWSARRDLRAVIAKGRLVDTADLDAAIDAELSRFRAVWARHASRLLARLTMNRLARRFVA